MADTAKSPAKTAKIVTAPLVLAGMEDGSRSYLYYGASLDGVHPDEVKRLDELGFLGAEKDEPNAAPHMGQHPTTF